MNNCISSVVDLIANIIKRSQHINIIKRSQHIWVSIKQEYVYTEKKLSTNYLS